MDDEANGTVGSYALLLTEEYGGEEVFGKEWVILKKMFEVENPEEIILTTEEDGDLEDYERFNHIWEVLRSLVPVMEVLEEGGYNMYEFEGLRFIFHYDSIAVIYLKAVDREKFNEVMNKI